MIRFYHEVVVLSYHAFAILVLALVFFGMSVQWWRFKWKSARGWRRVKSRVGDDFTNY